MPTTTITRRIDPCACGCAGRDPWHAREFTREIVNVTPATGTAKTIAYRHPVAIRAKGAARLPWGEGEMVRVVEVDRDGHSLGWFATGEVLG